MAKGTVKWFDRARGYGFITPDDGERDVFVSHTAIAGPIADGFRLVETGARVEFEAREGARGPEAVRVAPET
jgi:CspA family cold shock protein